MGFINNVKFKEIREAAKNGNEKALMVLQALKKSSPQDELDRLTGDYYGVGEIIPEQAENPLEGQNEPENPKEAETLAGNVEGDIPNSETSEDPKVEEMVEEQPAAEESTDVLTGNDNPVDNVNPAAEENSPIDLTDVLDEEMEGLIDENELEDLSFNDYLNNKRRDGIRSKKNSEYFQAYDSIGRSNYIDNKTNSYKEKFNGRLGNINRHYNDNALSLNNYLQSANDLLDDDKALDMDLAHSAYDEFTQDENIMNSFGRHWDTEDNNVITLSIKDLATKYGKNNVVAALNTLKSDNDGYRDFLNNQVDEEVNRYSKSLAKILK